MKQMISLFTCVMLLMPSLGFSWGKEGHQTVALIATSELTSLHALDRVLALLPAGVTLMDIATCPDEVRDFLRDPIKNPMSPTCRRLFPDPLPMGTEQQHFVNTPFASNATDSDITTACHNNCSISAIKKYEAILADSSQKVALRAQALSFLVHIVGDVHQPLHSIIRNHDSGGNAEHVTFNNEVVTLHHIWDEPVVENIGNTPASVMKALTNDITNARNAERTAKTTPLMWARGAFQIAKTTAYKGIPEANGTHSVATITGDYMKAANPFVHQQLALAGVRLAMLLATATSPGHGTRGTNGAK